jgi:hypothetical protein
MSASNCTILLDYHEHTTLRDAFASGVPKTTSAESCRNGAFGTPDWACPLARLAVVGGCSTDCQHYELNLRDGMQHTLIVLPSHAAQHAIQPAKALHFLHCCCLCLVVDDEHYRQYISRSGALLWLIYASHPQGGDGNLTAHFRRSWGPYRVQQGTPDR